MLKIDPAHESLPVIQRYLQGLVTPRPIALVSSIDSAGRVNLSPFSFFNLFSLNPPILVFSPSRRGRDNSIKHTLVNVTEVPEVVINVVSYPIIEQVSLASCEYPTGVNEFYKSGLIEVKSDIVKPPRVKESAASFECRVNQVLPLGNAAGSGNMVICEVLLIHISKDLIDEKGSINPWKLDATARLGDDYYARVQGKNIFHVSKPTVKLGIGFEALPEDIRNSHVLTGNDLGKLANVEQLPDTRSVDEWISIPSHTPWREKETFEVHKQVQKFLTTGQVEEAWKLILATSQY